MGPCTAPLSGCGGINGHTFTRQHIVTNIGLLIIYVSDLFGDDSSSSLDM